MLFGWTLDVHRQEVLFIVALSSRKLARDGNRQLVNPLLVKSVAIRTVECLALKMAFISSPPTVKDLFRRGQKECESQQKGRNATGSLGHGVTVSHQFFSLVQSFYLGNTFTVNLYSPPSHTSSFSSDLQI